MNLEAGSHQEDYEPREVAAARSVMNELWQVLGEYRDAMVLVGGWVPELMLPQSDPPHTGSLDVDVLLDPGPLRDGSRYAELVELLRSKGYEQTEKPFKLMKEVQGKIPDEPPIKVEVDFLLPKNAKTSAGVTLSDFRAIEADGAQFALRHQTEVKLDGELPDGRGNQVVLQIVTLAAFIVMKAFALAGRDKEKDAYDIHFCLSNYPGGPEGLSAALKPDQKDLEVQKALTILESKYRSPRDYGPASLVKFLSPESEDERAFLARDAYEKMRTFLDGMS